MRSEMPSGFSEETAASREKRWLLLKNTAANKNSVRLCRDGWEKEGVLRRRKGEKEKFCRKNLMLVPIKNAARGEDKNFLRKFNFLLDKQ